MPDSMPACLNPADSLPDPSLLQAPAPFDCLRPGGYDLIVADPAWAFATRSSRGWKKSPQNHYRCMPLAAIQALPVAELAAKDAVLVLWATWPMLPQALATIAAWGFVFKSGGHWHKLTKHGKQAFGTGYVVRCASEPFLIATRGRPRTSKRHRNAIAAAPVMPEFSQMNLGPVTMTDACEAGLEGIVREHSRKPDEVYTWLETFVVRRDQQASRRAELFARVSRPGWDAWGDQSDLFDGA
jgi:N6-adenosine-specific RNA methylase IME4